MGVTFHDKSNDSNQSMIGYSDATVSSSSARSNVSLDSSRKVAQYYGVSFINYLYLLSLIICQNFYATCATPNLTGPRDVE